MLTELRRRVYEHSENFNQETENTWKYQTEVTEYKEYNNWTGKYTREVQQQTGWSRRWISELENKAMEFTQTEQQKEKRIFKREHTLRDLWDNIKWNNIHIIGAPEREEREKGPENLFEEIIAEKFPNLWNKTDPGSPEISKKRWTQRAPHQDTV